MQKFLSFCVACGCGVLVSCSLLTLPKARVIQNRDEIQKEFHQELARQLNPQKGGELQLTWDQALEEMYMRNPSLLQADFKVEDAVSQQKRTFTSLIPLLSVGLSDSFEVEDIGEAFDEVNFRVFSYLPLGEVVRLPKQVYTKKLLYMGSQLNAEQTMRQEVIALYRLFQKQYLLKLEKRSLLLEGELSKGIVGLENEDALKMRQEYRKSYEDWEKRYEEWRIEVGDFFMGDYDQVELVRRSLPDISYEPSQLDFTDSGRWGMLQLNLLALEKISKDARIFSLYLNYLPRPNFNVSAPPLFSDTSTGSFDPSEIRLSPSLNWSLDTRGTISGQLERIKREKPLSDWREDKRRREEVKKLLDGQKSLVEIQAELHKLDQVIKGYQKVVKGGLVTDPRRAINIMRNLREKEVRLKAKEIEIFTSFWLIDEERWTKTTRRWQETRKIRAKRRAEERKRQKKLDKERKKSKKR